MEQLLRQLARLIMQRTIQKIESIDRDQTVSSFDFNGESYRRNRRTTNTIDTRFGPISYDRWYFQNTQAKTPGIAPLDVRLGIVAGRMSPALAGVTGRLAADLPQQAARDMLAERFSVTPSVEAYRRVVADLATQVRTVHDEEAIGQLIDWIDEARQSEGKHDVLLQVGRDGVFVQTRPCWEPNDRFNPRPVVFVPFSFRAWHRKVAARRSKHRQRIARSDPCSSYPQLSPSHVVKPIALILA